MIFLKKSVFYKMFYKPVCTDSLVGSTPTYSIALMRFGRQEFESQK